MFFLWCLFALASWSVVEAQQKSLDFSRVDKLYVKSAIATPTLTIEAWVKLTAANLTTLQGILLFDGWLSNGTGTSLHFMFWNGVPRLSVHAISKQGAIVSCCADFSANTAYKSDTWFHLAFTADLEAGSTSVFVNGQLIQTRTIEFDMAALTTRKFMVCPCAIGNYPGDNRHLSGLLGPVRLWKAVRSQTQIQRSMAGAPAMGDDAVFAFDDYSMVGGASLAVTNSVPGGGFGATATLRDANPTSSDWPTQFTLATTTTKTPAPTPATTTPRPPTTPSLTTMRTSTTTTTTMSSILPMSTSAPMAVSGNTQSTTSSSESSEESSTTTTTTTTTTTFLIESKIESTLTTTSIDASTRTLAIVNADSATETIAPEGPLSTMYIGIIAGALALLCLLTIVGVWCISRRKHNNRAVHVEPDSLHSFSSERRSHEYGRVNFDNRVPSGGAPVPEANSFTYASVGNLRTGTVEYDHALPATYSTVIHPSSIVYDDVGSPLH